MASATATARAEPGGREPDEEPQRRPLFRFGGSRLGGFILVLNLLSLLILFGGALAINGCPPAVKCTKVSGPSGSTSVTVPVTTKPGSAISLPTSKS